MNAVDVLKYGNQTLLRTIDELPDAAWETPGVCGIWSVKDIVAHLASYELVLVDVLSTFVDPGPTPYLTKYGEDYVGFNDHEVEARQGLTAAEVLDEYKTAHSKVMVLAAKIDKETFRRNGTLPWYGEEYDLDDFLVYTYYGHKREHSAQIAVFRDETKQ
jgi:uncharacterized damage-inducible protein DinB